MNTNKNLFALNFDDKLLTIRIDGKLIAAYPAQELGHTFLDYLFVYINSLILRPESLFKN